MAEEHPMGACSAGVQRVGVDRGLAERVDAAVDVGLLPRGQSLPGGQVLAGDGDDRCRFQRFDAVSRPKEGQAVACRRPWQA